jgi:ABC-type dipeptide/oligopeptide/nickel transport system permease component
MNTLLQRLVLMPLTLLVLSFLVFMLLEVTPGSATSAVLDDAASSAAAEAICVELRCDQPLLTRYGGYLGDVLRGDFGISIRSGRQVTDELRLRLPHTLIVTVGSISTALLIGGTVGLLAARRRGTWIDAVITVLTSVSASLPTFWIALLLTGLFAVQLGWLPVFGAGSAAHYILPVVSIALALMPGVAVIVRSSILDAQQQMFVATAQSKGLSSQRIFWRHIGPVAAIPVLTYVGLQAVHLVGGLVTIEVLFNLPGLGGLAVQAALDRDPLLLQGSALAIAAITLVALLLVDVMVFLLDPRIAQPVN